MDLLTLDYNDRVLEVATCMRARLALVSADADYDHDAATLLELVCESELCATERDARLVFALSPNWEAIDVGAFDDVRTGATISVALDVASLLGANWYLRYWGLLPRPLAGVTAEEVLS